MVYIETESHDGAFHFSVEEYMARDYPCGEPVMMIWQADRCVMLGLNQIAEAEIDTSYAKKEGITIVRRSSGGGTIFTDLGTLLFTLILPETQERYPLEIAKEKITIMVTSALNAMGVPVNIEGRNDILVDGKKVSGIAQYARHGRLCTHGSLLYDTDLETLARVLRADKEKISSKALKSVRSRVTNIKEYVSCRYSTREFWGLLKQNLFRDQNIREYKLTEHDLARVDGIYRQKYGNPSWTFTRSPEFSFRSSRRFPGGKVEVYLDVKKGVVESCSIRGDFLGLKPIRDLERVFEGAVFQREAFSRALDGVFLRSYLGNISGEELLSCVFD
ncbi:MAG: lipoate--protein ligase [Treponema sp.]|nr:lipoate--protein ligase [Treponema sp.]